MAEADVYENFFVAEGIPGPTVQKIMDWYVTDYLVIGGRSETGERPGDAEEAMRFLVDECRLTKAQADRLVKWHQAQTNAPK